VLGQRLRALRLRAGLSQEDLAARAGVALKTIGNIEAGRTTPRPSTLRALADALGVDFGAVTEPGEPTRAVVPAQLPAEVSAFAGRAAELARLDDLLAAVADRPPTVLICAVSGTAGVGKTALAVHWAHRVADRFPDGQLYVNLRGFDPGGQALDPAVAVRGFLDALDVPPQRIPADPDAQTALYRSLLSGKRLLIVLDNARDSTQVRPILPGAPGCLVLVTSRNRLTSLTATTGARPLPLDLLTDREARHLLARRLGADRIAAEPHAVRQIITHCARLPLALALVAAHATHQPHTSLATLARQLHDTRERWQTLTGDDPSTDLRAVFSWSYHALTPDAARLFRLLGLHPGPDLTAPAAASLAARPIDRVRPLLDELTQANLITEHTPGRYSLHDLLRTYATELVEGVEPEDQRHAATHRILDHYLHTAYTANRLLEPNRDPLTLTPPQPGVTPEQAADYRHAVDWFTAEHAVLLAAVERAAVTGFDTHTWQLTWSLWTFLDWYGHWHDQITAGRAALAGAERLADSYAQAITHRGLTHAYTRLYRLDDAHSHLSQALDLATEAGDLTGQGHNHHALAYLWEQRGRLDLALDHARRSLDLYRAAGHQRGQANTLNAVGWYHALLGDHQQALTYCEQALSLQQEVDNHVGQAHTWDSLGYVHHHLGHHTETVACYRQALALFRELGDRYNEATILGHLGDAHHTAGNREAAREAWQRALAILTDLDHPDAEPVRAKLHGSRAA
jgi:transcriptional regulator with XRE-family HTH domain/tetratricopeptide (TPR) repeat protein